MRLWILTHRRKISGRLLAGSGRFPDAVPKSSGRWPLKKAHRNPAARAGAVRRDFPSGWVEDQNPRSEPDWRLLSINLELTALSLTWRKDSGERGLPACPRRSLPTRSCSASCLRSAERSTGTMPVGHTVKMAELLFLPLGAAEQRQ